MTNKRNNPTLNWTMSIVAVALFAGCAHQAEKPKPAIAHGEVFTKPGAATSVGRFTQAQAANGAKADAMLYPRHFDGDQLNSLGQTKLDLILKASPAGQPVVVYLDMPHDQMTARQPAVAAYFKDAGLQKSQIELVEGPNPNATTPAAYNLPGIYKPAGTSYDGSAADLGSGAGGGGGVAAGMAPTSH
jgi:hypothetical protein